MKILKRVLSCALMLMMLASVFPLTAFGTQDALYTISNDYMKFSFNGTTGGFSVETLEGHPKKVLDDNIPLLYAEDRGRSNGTSFVTVRIAESEKDYDDYIFGQDYSLFGIYSSLGNIIRDGNVLTIPWTIKGITVTMKVALGNSGESNITGNAGISFEVKNTNSNEKNVSVRMLLDTALGNRTDAPYFVVDKNKTATLTETEFSVKKGDMPNQIRAVDSLTKPTKLSYIIMNDWNSGVKPNKVILGHWANIANTRYDYSPDKYCDFSNYSNNYRTPDSAVAIYWENNSLKNGESFTGEFLYGVGSFSDTDDVGINIQPNKNVVTGGEEFTATVTLDNALDNSEELSSVKVTVSGEKNKIEILEGNNSWVTFKQGDVKSFTVTMKALEQTDLTSGTFYVTVSGTRTQTGEDFETSAERSVVILSSSDATPKIQMNKVSPETVYTEGEKVITVSGEMSAVKGLLADTSNAVLKLYNKTAGDTVEIKKEKIAFLDADCKTLTFSTTETLVVGEYSIVFDLTNDTTLKDKFGCDTITCEQKLKVSANEKYRIKSYGLIALVRNTMQKGTNGTETDYDFYTFDKENEFLDFYYGTENSKPRIGVAKEGENSGIYDFSEETAIGKREILLTIRGNITQATEKDNNGKDNVYWTADYANGDIIINNMLSYEGSKLLKIYKSGNDYIVEGDGLVKVIDSINVWRHGWNITVSKSDTEVYTLDTERYVKAAGEAMSSKATNPNIKFSGAASLIQTLGGFAVSLKYGVLSSEWNKDYDNGMVTYGIGFGGKISIPIKAKKDSEDKKSESPGGTDPNQPNVVTAQAYANPSDALGESDVYEATKNMFGAAAALEYAQQSGELSGNVTTSSATGGNASGEETTVESSLNSMYGGTPASESSTGDVMKKDEDLPEGSLSAEVNNVLFGEKYDSKQNAVTEMGFKGIDAKLSLELPKDVLGSFVSNAPGIKASVTINTIDNVYEIEAGLSLKIIECEGVLAFKQVTVKNKEAIVPDKIEFYIRDGLKIPLAAPVLFMTGLGGGINELADTIGGEFEELPPITLLLYTKLEAISALEGEFNAKLSLEEMSLTGDMQLSYKGFEKFLKMNAGISARWIEPWELSLYGNVNVIDGIIKGGITVTIADDYFYGYVYAKICVPDSIPLVGGKTLRGAEAAVSHEFIGANITIIGIKLGVKYYWGDKVSFGSNIDLSAPPKPNPTVQSMAMDTSSPYAVGYYGTNVYALPARLLSSSGSESTSGDNYNTVTASVSNADGKYALLFEIPYEGEEPTEKDEIILCNENGVETKGVIDENMLIQHRDDGDYIYMTVKDTAVVSGEWTLKYSKNSGFEIKSFNVSAVDDIPTLESTTITNLKTTDKTNMTVDASWEIKGNSAGKSGTIDVYLTEDKDILNKIKTEENTGDILGTNIYHANGVTASGSKKITLPNALPSGKYYAVTTFSTGEGIDLKISKNYIDFTNPNLPNLVDSVKISYGGNGEIFVQVTDNKTVDYTHYIAEIVEVEELEDGTVKEKGTVLENNVGQFEQGKSFTFGKEANLKAGNKYKVKIKTLREEYEKAGNGAYKTHYYYGSETKSSDWIKIDETQTPKLKSVRAYYYDAYGEEKEIDLTKDEINVNSKDIIVEYTFENDVFAVMKLNSGYVYSYGKNPDITKLNSKEGVESLFKTQWKFVLDDLEDGDYTVDFFAYTLNKDSIYGNQVTDVDNAYFAFNVDTSAPVLSLSHKNVKYKIDETENEKDEDVSSTIKVSFGGNTVFADENGKYTIEGITEKTATLKLDGEEVGKDTVKADGSFKLEKTLAAGVGFTSHVITAEDKAGNISQITVWVIRQGEFTYSNLALYADGKKVENDQNGEKTVTLRNGQAKNLEVYVTSGKKSLKIDNESVDWSVLYSKNSVYINNGNITALSPGKTAVKAKLVTANLETKSENENESAVKTDVGLSDYVIINIEDNTKDDLTAKIADAKTLLSGNPQASSSKKEALNKAIKQAEDIVNNADSTGEDYTNGVEILSKAMTAFNAAEESTYTSSLGGSGTTRYSISAQQTQNGKIELSQTKVVKGNSVTIKAIPDEGYVVADMLINGESVGKKEIYTVSAVNGNIVVTVVFEEKSDELPFTDVVKSDWYYDFVKTAYENGYMNGTSATEFEPEITLTRGMFVTVLHRIDGGRLIGENPFEDVTEDAYYKDAVAWANASGIVNGISAKEFAPEASITREQMATMLYRYAKYRGLDVSVGEDTNILSYEDYSEISDYAVSAMQYAVGSGLMVGKTQSTLNPKDTATRAEAATVFVRFSDMLK